MSRTQRLIYSIVEFLASEQQTASLSSDAAESLEVAIQCLETAYGIERNDETRSRLHTPMPLLDMFTTVTGAAEDKFFLSQDETTPSTEDLAEAERVKVEGNDLMKAEKHEDALRCYSKAINLDKKNPIYYCNRGAAYIKLNNFKAAVDDCKKAIELDPRYSRAYGRLGVAYMCLNRHQEAKESYEKAIELDPGNEGYINNLRMTEEKLKEARIGGNSGPSREAPGGTGGTPGFPAGLDFGTLLTNPALMNMATQVMSDPNMQQMMGQFLSGTMGGAATEPQGGGGGGQGMGGAGGVAGGFDALLQAGQQLAQQMQAANPDLVEQLRRQMNPNNDDHPPSHQ